MIFYFSGTGNSLWVAKGLSKALNEPMTSIDQELQKKENALSYPIGNAERVVFVFPVHSWGVPVIIPKFVKQLRLEGYTNQPIHMVCTCGDDCGKTASMFSKLLKRKGYVLSGGYSIQMPNCYILLPGFDVDSKEVERAKLSSAPERLKKITEAIANPQLAASHQLYHKGSMAFVKSRLVYPLFKKFALRVGPFRVTAKCTLCGLCATVCPTQSIGLTNEKPFWRKTCIQCLACINRCPSRAIEYGNATVKKGRYKHPELS